MKHVRAIAIVIFGLVPIAGSAQVPDVIVGEVQNPQVYAEHDGTVALTFDTVSCNAGTAQLNWYALPDNRHPVIALSIFREQGGRFQQLGRSWVKHGFTALQLGDVCTKARDPDFPHNTCTPSSTGSQLGVGCADPYSGSINRGPRLGSPLRINPLTGYFEGVTDHINHGHAHPLGIEHGLQVRRSDLEETENGARYFIESQYVAADDAIAGNGKNNASYREYFIDARNGSLVFRPVGGTIRRMPAIKAWRDAEISDLDTPEETADGVENLTGRVSVGFRSIPLGNGRYRYEYVVHNLTSARNLRSFSVPIGSLTVNNSGFYSPPKHVESDLSSKPWEAKQEAGSITWTMQEAPEDPKGNALRWGEAFNFWFEADAEPVSAVAMLEQNTDPGNFVSATVIAPASDANSLVLGDKDLLIRALTQENVKLRNQIGLTPISAVASDPVVAVDQGLEREAIAYYSRISSKLGFQVDGSSMNGLLDWLGYAGLSADDLEYIAPDVLHVRDTAGFDALAATVSEDNREIFLANFDVDDFAAANILSSRFIAPKIVDISAAPPYGSGWRKLVRLAPRQGSGAKAVGVQSAYVLFNYARAQDDPNPFPLRDDGDERASKNSQVMLTVDPASPNHDDSLYWIVYGEKAEGYPSKYFLSAIFDMPIGNPGTDGKYFVPKSCAQCHGGGSGVSTPAGLTYPAAKLNFLDTDHWWDRVQSGEYYETAGTLSGVLFDGGVDPTKPIYGAAFDIIRTLNVEIQAQNTATDSSIGGEASLQTLGATKWIDIHAGSSEHFAPVTRALDTGGEVWSNTPDDAELLSLLNRHCYRCHSSVAYSVFDKQAVINQSGFIGSFVQFGIMPQGHDLLRHEPAEANRLIELINEIE